MYVVIYNYRQFIRDQTCEEEQYYGYFSTSKEAERMYSRLTEGEEEHYANARICKITRPIGRTEFS